VLRIVRPSKPALLTALSNPAAQGYLLAWKGRSICQAVSLLVNLNQLVIVYARLVCSW
jgi:hypothetical protein